MNESESLDALSNILNSVAESPYEISRHAQHIQLAQSLEGLDAEVQSAMEMATQFLAVGDEVWLPLILAKEQSVDLNTEEGVEELLALYARAENDYLSIPILEKHVNFLIERHALYNSGEIIKPESLGETFTTPWTREAISIVVKKGVIHLTESHKIWDLQRDWELEMLEATLKAERSELVEYVQNLHLERLHQPHLSLSIVYYAAMPSISDLIPLLDIEDTLQSYSSFTTNYLPPQDYESTLVAATKIRGQSVRNFDRRDRLETAIKITNGSLESYNQYIRYERRAKYPDLFVTRGVFERAIAEAAKSRFVGNEGAEEALRMFWINYCDSLRTLNAGVEQELETYRRAVRSVPGSGEVWARYLRLLERASEEASEDQETIPDIYNRAIDAKLVQSDIEQLAPLVLARGGYEKRSLEAGSEDENALPTLIGVVESGIELSRQASKSIDPKLRLEKFLVSIYENVGLLDSAFDVWKAAAKHTKSSYLVWLNYTDALIKHQMFDDARKTFLDIHSKQLDWPEAIWEAWISFEHLHGSISDIEACLDKIEIAQYQTDMRRAKEAAKAQMTAAEAFLETAVETTTVPVSDIAAPEADTAMEVHQSVPERGTKRAAEDEPSPDAHKKARTEPKPAPLKRDRENSTVFVADLPTGTAEDDLRTVFKDCGDVREVKFTQLPSALVATVELFDRENVPAALTKDKKKILDQEISVHLAWRSTLYVTNFPESTDDAFIRDLFGKYGTIFDVRWPSKKFKNTRRFCYVQFTSPDAAQNCLKLHGRELEPNLPLNVYLSNPERKKERTDQDANEKEVYVAGLSRFTNKFDLEKLFSTYGTVKDIRIALDDNGHARGFAFVEFEDAKDAQNALSANNHELKKRRLAVTLADPRVRAKHKSDIGISRVAEIRNKSVRIKNLPPAAQEGLLQQVLEKIAPVKRLEVFLDKQEALLELENPADAGRLLLRTEPLEFGGNVLELTEDAPTSRPAGTAKQGETNALFKPRKLGPSKPKAGLGFKKPLPPSKSEGEANVPVASSSASGGNKGQDDFRKMLARK